MLWGIKIPNTTWTLATGWCFHPTWSLDGKISAFIMGGGGWLYGIDSLNISLTIKLHLTHSPCSLKSTLTFASSGENYLHLSKFDATMNARDRRLWCVWSEKTDCRESDLISVSRMLFLHMVSWRRLSIKWMSFSELRLSQVSPIYAQKRPIKIKKLPQVKYRDFNKFIFA